MDTAKLFPWFILLNPLIAAVLILVGTRKNHGLSAVISTLSVVSISDMPAVNKAGKMRIDQNDMPCAAWVAEMPSSPI